MRYYVFGFLFATAITVFTFHLETNFRSPASYPNFSGSADLIPVAPTPRDLAAPTNSSNPFSMKDIEDTYKGFLANESALDKQATASRARLQHLLELRNNNPNVNYYVNSSSQLLQAIQAEQNNLQRIEGQRQSNSLFAFQKINLLYLSIQIGLRPESHARVSELTDYLMHVNYSAVATEPSHALVQTPTLTSWNDAALLEYTPRFSTVATPPSVSNDFIGPRLPETQPRTVDVPASGSAGTVAI